MLKVLKLFKLKLSKPNKQHLYQHKSIIMPDGLPYRFLIYYNDYRVRNNKPNSEDELNLIRLCAFTTILYPFYERYYLLYKDLKNQEIKPKIIKDINIFTVDYGLLCTEISMYPDPNGYDFQDSFNLYLERDYIHDGIHKR